MIKRVLMLGMISLAAVSAADKNPKFDVTLYQPVVLGGTVFKAGEAKVEIVDGTLVLKQGKTTAQTPVKVELAKDKFIQTRIAFKDGANAQISEIWVGGTTKHVLFPEAVGGQ